MTSADPNPDHRVAVVVGAGPGIGAEMAVRYARSGYRAFALARSEPSLEAVRAAADRAQVTVTTRAVDASDPAALAAALDDIMRADGPIRAALYNAADLSRGRMRDVDAQQFAASLAVNVGGAHALIQAVRGPMGQAGGGVILLTGGGLAVAPSPVFAPLSVGKAALRALAHVAARDLDREGIHLATLTIAGFVGPDGPITPQRAADALWALHVQRREDGWEVERELSAG